MAVVASDIFFRTFKDCINDLVQGISVDTNSSDPATTNAVHVISKQLHGNFGRLQYAIKVIQARLCEDAVWATSTAVTVYELLAMSIDPAFPHPDPQMPADFSGAIVVRDQLMRACQAQFQQTMAMREWSRGLITFLGQLCTIGNTTSTTPGVVLHIIDGMMTSTSLTTGENFDIFVGFMMRAGPFFDSHVGIQEHLTARMERLKDRARGLGMTESLAIYGILQLRQKGWRVDEMECVV
ncbi:hypothetical protein EJ02DRAFT_63736 [Clathrospora elynae]|uniref:Uncharacterized protein n=1 Tax=Clathrospora elynae TaxID=706981 RepID=A0A6A5SBV2_9PLEO|nr:hypothetical protein EJ02DRAFT_63736 [Clathrospora elynae]